MVFRVQIEGIPSYDEEQVALVVEDGTTFGQKVPVLLGMPTQHRVVKCMKESEMEELPPEWQSIKMGYEVRNQITAF